MKIRNRLRLLSCSVIMVIGLISFSQVADAAGVKKFEEKWTLEIVIDAAGNWTQEWGWVPNCDNSGDTCWTGEVVSQ